VIQGLAVEELPEVLSNLGQTIVGFEVEVHVLVKVFAATASNSELP
jgi:hypothetical protein